MTAIDPEIKEKPNNFLRVLLLLCWGMVLAKTYFLLRGHPTPTVIEYSYIVALPTVLWNLKPGLDILGTWFYIAVLSVIGLGIIFWIFRQWRRYILEDPKGWPIGWTIGTSILAINFVILIFFVGRELVNASKAAAEAQQLEFEEPPTHPPPDAGTVGPAVEEGE